MISRLSFILIFLISSYQTIAQEEKPPVEIEGRITNFITNSSIGGASVQVYKNGNLIETKTTSSSGKYKLSDLQLNNSYKIVISANGMVPRFVEIDLRNIPDKNVFKKGWEIPIDIPLAERIPNVDFSRLEPKRTSIIKFDKNAGDIDWDYREIETYRDELTALLKKLEKKKVEQEEKKPVEIKNLQTITAADNALLKNDYEAAIKKYEQAINENPENNKEIIKKLEIAQAKYKAFKGDEERKEMYNSFMQKGNERFKSGDYTSAFSYFKQALEKIPGDVEANKQLGIVAAAINEENAKEKRYDMAISNAKKEFDAGRYEAAANYYRAALKEKPDDDLAGIQLEKAKSKANEKPITSITNGASVLNGNSTSSTVVSTKLENSSTVASNKVENVSSTNTTNTNNSTASTKVTTNNTTNTNVPIVNTANSNATANSSSVNSTKVKNSNSSDKVSLKNNSETLNPTSVNEKSNSSTTIFVNNNAENSIPKVLTNSNSTTNSNLNSTSIISTKEDNTKQYNQAVEQGNNELSAGNFDKAIASFNLALTYKPNDVYASKQINRSKNEKENIRNEKEKMYNNIVQKADEYFSAKNFQNALDLYKRAYKFNKNNQAVIAKIKQSELALRSIESIDTFKVENSGTIVKGLSEIDVKKQMLAAKIAAEYENSVSMINAIDQNNQLYRDLLYKDGRDGYTRQEFLNYESFNRSLLFTDSDKYRNQKAKHTINYLDYLQIKSYQRGFLFIDNNYNRQQRFNKQEYDIASFFLNKDAIRRAGIDRLNGIVDSNYSFISDRKQFNYGLTSANNSKIIGLTDSRSSYNNSTSGNYLENAEQYKNVDDRVGNNTNNYQYNESVRVANNNVTLNKTEPKIPKKYNSEYFALLVNDLGDGIHQWTSKKLGPDELPYETIIRRIVVKNGIANDYSWTQNKWGAVFTKNGIAVVEHVWEIETAGKVKEYNISNE